jgi:hypothetical protein
MPFEIKSNGEFLTLKYTVSLFTRLYLHALLAPLPSNKHFKLDCSNYCAHFHLYNYTLRNLGQFYTLGMVKGLVVLHNCALPV